MALFDDNQSIIISYHFEDELLDLYGITNKDRLIDTLTMIFRDCNTDINVNLAFVKELMDEETISRDEACLLIHQLTLIYSQLNHLRNTVNKYCEN